MGLKDKTIFLFGAGSTISWGSPTTMELTSLVRQSGFKIIDNKTTITEFIYGNLINRGFKESDINFETIINVIEELIIYYSNFNAIGKIPSLISVFFEANFEETLFNFSIKGGKEKYIKTEIPSLNYRLQIPAGVDYDFSQMSRDGIPPPQFFFQHLLAEILTNICARISNYSYHSDSYSIVDIEKENSVSFVRWISRITSKSVIRLYTLNYDKIFKVLLEANGIPVFEGFEDNDISHMGYNSRSDVDRILNDFDINIFYNLHGSIHWTVEGQDRYQLQNAEVLLTNYSSLPINDDTAIIQIEKGKNIVISNIVTGYQKAQKSFITPFKQMQSAFDKDCIIANNIYIIGYSFGDEHINTSIKTALRYNKNLKIYIVDPAYIEGGLNNGYELLKVHFINIFTELLDKFNCEKINDYHYSYFDGKIIVYTLRFEEFLKLQANL